MECMGHFLLFIELANFPASMLFKLANLPIYRSRVEIL